MKRRKASEFLIYTIYGFAFKNQVHLTFVLETNLSFYISFTNFELIFLHLLSDYSGAHEYFDNITLS